MSTSTSYPALTGNEPTERHARICREEGHATHLVDGVDTGICPRCGELKIREGDTVAWQTWCGEARAVVTYLTQSGRCHLRSVVDGYTSFHDSMPRGARRVDV